MCMCVTLSYARILLDVDKSPYDPLPHKPISEPRDGPCFVASAPRLSCVVYVSIGFYGFVRLPVRVFVVFHHGVCACFRAWYAAWGSLA